MRTKYANAYTANGQNVYLGQKIKTSMHINAENGIVKSIDNENNAVFVLRVKDNTGGWYSINTIISA
jgi:hypothetical protein